MTRWNPTREDCGIITLRGKIKEVENKALDPHLSFEFPEGVLEKAKASWHTHPARDANLSIPDYYFFKSWPSLVHFIVYRSEVRCYTAVDGRVYSIDEEEDFPPRLLEGSLR